MVILLRTNSGWDEEFKAVLEEEGIPVYITSRTGYFGASEVQELLQVLRVLDNPRQDIPLFGMMKSVFGGFTEEEIALIRSRRRDCTLYEAAAELAAEYGTVQPVRELAFGEKAGGESRSFWRRSTRPGGPGNREKRLHGQSTVQMGQSTVRMGQSTVQMEPRKCNRQKTPCVRRRPAS